MLERKVLGKDLSSGKICKSLKQKSELTNFTKLESCWFTIFNLSSLQNQYKHKYKTKKIHTQKSNPNFEANCSH